MEHLGPKVRTLCTVALAVFLLAPTANFWDVNLAEDCWHVQFPKVSRTAALSTYFAPYLSSTVSTSESDMQAGAYIVPVDATIKEIRVQTQNGPAGFATVTHAIMEVTDGATAASCVRVFTVDVECEATVSVNVDQYDRLYERATKSTGTHDPGYGMTEILLCKR